jgi:hypothetical protein
MLINIFKKYFYYHKFETFQLETTVIRIGILRPIVYNPLFVFFTKFRDYDFFKFILKVLLRIPYWLIGSFPGYLFLSFCFFWAFSGRELITVSFSLIYITELANFCLVVKYFLHLDGVYRFCLDTYGPSFMEKYLGNPVGKTLAQRFSLGFVSASAGFTADQLDRQICHTRVMEGVREVIEQHQALNHKITKEELFEIRRTMNEDCKNIPRVDQFSDTIKTMLGSLGKK